MKPGLGGDGVDPLPEVCWQIGDLGEGEPLRCAHATFSFFPITAIPSSETVNRLRS